MKAIVLCGGLGTRLGVLTKDMPKPLLTVAGRPFIAHVLDRLTKAGITELVLAVGFQWAKIREYIGNEWNGIPVEYVIESEPLGTGGAIKNVFISLGLHESIVLNGDTLFDIDISNFLRFATDKDGSTCIALRKVEDCSRYGKVSIDANGRLIAFGEKDQKGSGLINGGIYFLRSRAIDGLPLTSFSFETAYLQERHSIEPIFGMAFEDYFIDIGIPSDLARAQLELMAMKK